MDKKFTRIILVRHGETQENVSRVVLGHRPGVLTPKGQKQAELVAEAVSKEGISAMYVSDLQRSVETADIICLRLSGKVKPILDKRLREQNFGIHEGKPLRYLLSALRESGRDLANFDPLQGETSTCFHDRIDRAIEEYSISYRGKSILLVTHFNVINYLLQKAGIHKKQIRRFMVNGCSRATLDYSFEDRAFSNCIIWGS